MIILRLSGMMGALLACAPKQPEKQISSDSLKTSDVRESITDQIGEPKCSSAAVCRTIAFGVKPCGGPYQYLVYSTSATDSARLARDVARYNSAEEKKNREEGRMSDCSLVLKPRVSCISGRCVAETAERRQVY
jgi:hypothetical protein